MQTSDNQKFILTRANEGVYRNLERSETETSKNTQSTYRLLVLFILGKVRISRNIFIELIYLLAFLRQEGCEFFSHMTF